ncbi:hypothetical protein M5K25_004325 [Dendrobium thyrsiflorum]|uniref:Cytochrome b561 and DOMON domain-containing protein n=1 Tax=Dendrobium thyrsiflorum TaxID=117978 RepID=A0ABD0VU49_DENTH
MLLVFLLLASSTAASASGHCSPETTTKPYVKCLTLPTQDASIAWTYHPHNASVDLSFTGTFISPSGWVAFGINPESLSMSGTRALISFADPTSASLLVLPFLLDSSVKLQRSPLLSHALDIPFLSSSASLLHSASVRTTAVIRISASLRLSPNRTRINLIWNRGLYVQGYSPTIHPTTPADLASRATIDLLSSSADISSTLPTWFRSAHGSINAITWGFFIPAGAMAARYLRQWPGMGPAWFYVHAAVQMTAVVIGAVGFGLGVAMGNGVYTLHKGLGIAVMTAGGLQAAAMFFRPAATHRCRKYWKSYHHLVGYGLVVIGVVNVFQGMELMGLGRSYAKLVYCLALATMAGASVALEVNGWVVFLPEGGGGEGYELVVIGVVTVVHRMELIRLGQSYAKLAYFFGDGDDGWSIVIKTLDNEEEFEMSDFRDLGLVGFVSSSRSIRL